MGFVASFVRFQAMQNFWKSVKIWQSYGEFKGGNFLRHSVVSKYWPCLTGADRDFGLMWRKLQVCFPLQFSALLYSPIPSLSLSSFPFFSPILSFLCLLPSLFPSLLLLFQFSVVTLKLRKEYLNAVICDTPVLLQMKNRTVLYMKRFSVSAYTEVTNL